MYYIMYKTMYVHIHGAIPDTRPVLPHHDLEGVGPADPVYSLISVEINWLLICKLCFKFYLSFQKNLVSSLPAASK